MAVAAKKKTKQPVATGSAWDSAVLRGIGAPVTKGNLLILALWRRLEGGPADNPLNTSLNTSNVTATVNSSGVKRYNSVQAGIDATVATLKLPYYTEIVSLFKTGHAGAPQLAEAISASPWDAGHYGAKKTPSGAYIGGNFVNATLGPAIHQPGFGTALGDIGHYIAHPGAGVQTTAGAAAGVLDKPLMYILYGGAILGGFMLVLIAFVLIGADLGISALRSHPVATGTLGVMKLQNRQNRARQSSSGGGERRAEEIHRERVRLTRARTGEVHARRRAGSDRARANKTERETIRKQAYTEGAIDAASPTMAKIKRDRIKREKSE